LEKTSLTERIILSAAMLMVLAVILMLVAPLPKATVDNCNTYSGVVSKVLLDGGPGDIVIILRNDKNHYYINRGTELGLSVTSLRSKLVNKTIELMTIRHSSLLDPFYRSRHIARITVDGGVLYSEL
jgi:hypothetical protein